jgi:hypothetical protein
MRVYSMKIKIMTISLMIVVHSGNNFKESSNLVKKKRTLVRNMLRGRIRKWMRRKSLKVKQIRRRPCWNRHLHLAKRRLGLAVIMHLQKK